MVAPIAVEALVTLPQNPFDQSLCWWLCRWGCGRRRAFPRFSSWLGKRGKRSRSAKPIVHISIGIVLRTLAGACDSHGSDVGALVVENQPSLDAGFSLGEAAIGVQVDLLVFEAAP